MEATPGSMIGRLEGRGLARSRARITRFRHWKPFFVESREFDTQAFAHFQDHRAVL